MIGDRQKNILKSIVEEYIKTARPVGSKSLCKKFKCSSATIRNDMLNLEELGYLEKQHISSGRIPSEKGYRYYVDYLMEPKKISGEDMLKLQTIFSNNELNLSSAIEKSLEIISDITNYTSVVLGKASSDNNLQKVELIPITEETVVAIVITDKGIVENPIIGNYVKNYEVLYNAFYEAFSNFATKESVKWRGKANILKQPEFSNVDDVKNIVKIYIGKESEFDDNVTVIKTKLRLNGEDMSIAVIGPKRMEYGKVVTMLEYIKDNLEKKG